MLHHKDYDRIAHLVTVVRLTIGYFRWKNEAVPVDDLDELYKDLCELSELLDLPPPGRAKGEMKCCTM
jgi:hypothetical protein